jgi:hypothetical protein
LRHISRSVFRGYGLQPKIKKSKDKASHMSLIDADALGAGWRKASRSVNNGACVEAASARVAVMVRDSVDPSGPVVAFPVATWRAFIATAKDSTSHVVR